MQRTGLMLCFVFVSAVSCQATAPATAPASAPNASAASAPAEFTAQASQMDGIAAAGDQMVNAMLDLHGILLACQEPPTSAEQLVIQERRAQALSAWRHLAALTVPVHRDLEALRASDSVPMPPGQAGLNAAIELLSGWLAAHDDAALFGEAGLMDQDLLSLPLEKRQAFHALDRASALQVELKLIVQAMSSLPADHAGASSVAP